MMKVLVISDSHGDSATVRMLLERYKDSVQMAIHLGDNAKDLLQFDRDYPGITFVAVAGNCDYYGQLLNERILSIGNAVQRRVLALHGHDLNVKSSYDRLMYYAQEKEVDACLFGHSHMPFVHEHGPVFLMNPGSTSQPRGGSRASYGLLIINDNGDIQGGTIEL